MHKVLVTNFWTRCLHCIRSVHISQLAHSCAPLFAIQSISKVTLMSLNYTANRKVAFVREKDAYFLALFGISFINLQYFQIE